MTTANEVQVAQGALQAAEAALAAFDAGTLVHEDGSVDEAQQAKLKRLQDAVDAAQASLRAAQGA